MREMKDSGVEWIGEIPQNWNTVRLKYMLIADKNSMKVGPFGSQLKGTDFVTEGIAVYNQRTVLDNEFDISNVFISKEKFDTLTGFEVQPLDILITTRGTIGKIAIVPEKVKQGIIHPCIIKFAVNDAMINRNLLKYIFNDTTVVIEQLILASNATTIPVVYSEPLKNVYLPLTDLEEQERILAFLDSKCSKIDVIIQKQQVIIDKLKEYKLSIITETVTKGLNPDVEMKDSGNTWFGYIPTHWDCVISRFVFEKVSDINHFMPESVDSGYPYLMIGDLKEHISDIDFDNCKKISKEDFDCLKQKMKSQKGDVIFARYATIGTVCYVDIDIDFLVSYACVTVRPNKELYGEYLYYYFKSCAFRENVKQFINSNTQENVEIEALCKTKITIPPYKEQKMIANYLNEKSKKIDISIEKKRQIIDKLQEYKKSLIYEVVTGKKEV